MLFSTELRRAYLRAGSPFLFMILMVLFLHDDNTILDNSGNVVVKYAYDAYGNCNIVIGANHE